MKINRSFDNFGPIFPKECFSSEKEKGKIIELQIFELVWKQNFIFKKSVELMEKNFPKRVYFKIGKLNITI